MGTTTPNLGLTKPTPGDPADRNLWGGTVNGNTDKLDAIFKDDGTGTSVGLKVGSGKTLNIFGALRTAATSVLDFLASTFFIRDDTDTTKFAKFDASGISTGTTRTFTFPDASGVLALAGGGGGGLSNYKVTRFTAAGPFTPDPDAVLTIIDTWGGGGGGGGANNTSTGSINGGGGGAGGHSRTVATPTDIGASLAVTIGAAGTAGVAGNNDGGAGGATSAGTLCSANGGAGGGSGNNSGGAFGTGGAGGTPGTGNILAAPGASGASAFSVTGTFISSFRGMTAGSGASTEVGAGGLGHTSTSPGGAATGYGAGGAGGQATGASTAAGFAGAPGLAIFVELLK